METVEIPGEHARKAFPWGCLWGGCLTVLLIGVGISVAAGMGSYWFYSRQVTKYTSSEARHLPVVEASREKVEAIEERVESFQVQASEADSPEQLILTAEDINTLISNERRLRGRVFVAIRDGMLQADVSFPTDALPGAEGRYFNGSVVVDAAIEEGVLIVRLEEAQVNGEAVPELVMQELRKQNLAKDVHKNRQLASKLERFETLEIVEDKVIFTARHTSTGAEGEADELAPPPSQPLSQVDNVEGADEPGTDSGEMRQTSAHALRDLLPVFLRWSSLL